MDDAQDPQLAVSDNSFVPLNEGASGQEQGRPHDCFKCGKRFELRCHRLEHMALHFPRLKRHKCGICGKRYYRAELCQLHEASHSTEPNTPGEHHLVVPSPDAGRRMSALRRSTRRGRKVVSYSEWDEDDEELFSPGGRASSNEGVPAR